MPFERPELCLGAAERKFSPGWCLGGNVGPERFMVPGLQ
jgi:hypothetical protein